MNDDTISRKQAIDALMSLTIYKSKREIVQAADKDENSWIGGVAECIDEIEDLPSAQPEPCEDTVSRKAVQYLLAHFVDENKYVDACDGLKQLPPVTPKQRTGKCMWCERLKERNLRIEYYWIDEEGCTASFSEPHIVATGIAKFCPNCGAKITEGDAE